MKHILMAFVAVLAGSAFALADTPVSPAEAEKIKAALDALGCSGGKMEKETEGSSVFEDRRCEVPGRAIRHQARQGLQAHRDDPRLSARCARAPSAKLKSPDPFGFHAAVIGWHCARQHFSTTI